MVPTATFKLLFVLIILSNDRRKIIHFNVTQHPSAEWTARQVIEACPYATSPKYLIRDRDRIYGNVFKNQIKNMGIEEIVTAFQSPWQNPFAERVIGSIRRECLNHLIILNEKHLHKILKTYFEYYHRDRTHLGLEKDTPDMRPVQVGKPNAKVVALPRVGGLHHRYEWKQAA